MLKLPFIKGGTKKAIRINIMLLTMLILAIPLISVQGQSVPGLPTYPPISVRGTPNSGLGNKVDVTPDSIDNKSPHGLQSSKEKP